MVVSGDGAGELQGSGDGGVGRWCWGTSRPWRWLCRAMVPGSFKALGMVVSGDGAGEPVGRGDGGVGRWCWETFNAGRINNLNNSRACRCGGDCFDVFSLAYRISFLSPFQPLSLSGRRPDID